MRLSEVIKDSFGCTGTKSLPTTRKYEQQIFQKQTVFSKNFYL
jgi:hypothetical protein